MACHSKWANTKHRKAAQDSKRAKIWTKLLKEVGVAVKQGGPDADSNPRLRLAMQNCRGGNVPKDNIERAIAKASGAGAEDYIETTFEGYGPDGVAVFVECATDNNTRTVSAVRSYFTKCGGSLGKDGCLQFIFDRKSIFTLARESVSMDEDDFMMEMIDAGAEDVDNSDDEFITVIAAMEDFGPVSSKLHEMNIEPKEAGLKRIPNNFKALNGKSLEMFEKLIDLLEDNDDVQQVYHNLEFTE